MTHDPHQAAAPVYDWRYGVLYAYETRDKQARGLPLKSLARHRKVECVYVVEFLTPIKGWSYGPYMRGPFQTRAEAEADGVELATLEQLT